MASTRIEGVAVFPRIAIGKAFLVHTDLPEPAGHSISAGQEDAEKQALDAALQSAKKQVESAIADARDEDRKAIFTAHLDILDDPELYGEMVANIDKKKMNAQLALYHAMNDAATEFEGFDDEYMRERAVDIRDEYGRLICIMTGATPTDLSHIPEGSVLVARDLTPSQTAGMDLGSVRGFATDLGGKTSHTSIMAQSAALAAVVGCRDVFGQTGQGDAIIVDGEKGVVVVRPSEETLAEYEARQKALEQKRQRLAALRTLPAETRDGRRIDLAANAGGYLDIKAALAENADGVGLYRSEFLYMNSSRLPTEEEQYLSYKDAAEGMQGRPVIIRTLDIGGDKDLPYLGLGPEQNPFLGFRALRISLAREELFRAQLRAILRASAHGKVRIMFPMVISLEEFAAAKGVVESCMASLDAEKIPYDKDIEVGIMVETPAAIFMADVLAEAADFFSIGTNDLTQYTLVVDRGNEKVRDLYSPYHPAVLRAIKHVIDASHRAGKWTGMCGAFAGEEKAIPLLLGMGLDEFSVSAPLLQECKDVIRNADMDECRNIAAHVLRLPSRSAVECFLLNETMPK